MPGAVISRLVRASSRPVCMRRGYRAAGGGQCSPRWLLRV